MAIKIWLDLHRGCLRRTICILEVYVACFAWSTANFLFADFFLKQNFWHEFFFEFENFWKFSKKLKIWKFLKFLKKSKKKFEKNFWSEKKFLWIKKYPSPTLMQSPAKKVLKSAQQFRRSCITNRQTDKWIYYIDMKVYLLWNHFQYIGINLGMTFTYSIQNRKEFHPTCWPPNEPRPT